MSLNAVTCTLRKGRQGGQRKRDETTTKAKARVMWPQVRDAGYQQMLKEMRTDSLQVRAEGEHGFHAHDTDFKLLTSHCEKTIYVTLSHSVCGHLHSSQAAVPSLCKSHSLLLTSV